MDLELTQEQIELRSLASELLAKRVPREAPRAYLEGAGDAAGLWSELAELGWYGVGLDDDDAFGVPGLCVLAEQLGRRLTSSVCRRASGAHRRARPSVRRRRPPRGAGVARRRRAEAQWSPHGVETVRFATQPRLLVSGTKLGVKHGEPSPGMAWSRRSTAAGIRPRFRRRRASRSRRTRVDPTGNEIRLVLDDVAVGPESIVANAHAADAIERAFAVGAVATAAEAVGAASASLDLAIDYAREREQFGRPIGAYQAVQHILADAHVLRETAWSAVLYASAALDEETPDGAEAATVAKAYVSRAARSVVESALQVFGGIGFTWEHDLHLFLRRVLACEQRFGDSLFHERQLAAALASRAEDRFSAGSGRRLR
jgi:alkylation response protein AidB-like acyl-CoA dehydrogenase